MFSRTPVRLILVSCAVVLLLHFGSRGGLRGLASDVLSLRSDRAELSGAVAREESIHDQLRRTAARTDHQSRLHAAMLANEMTLREACAEFRAVVAEDERFERLVAATCAGETPDERLATYLLSALFNRREWVDGNLNRVRFEEEYRDWFGHGPEIVVRSGPADTPARADAAPRLPLPAREAIPQLTTHSCSWPLDSAHCR